nr:uncharacterized protein LOC101736861 isoform X6 [Bombyx mori]
MKLVEFVVAMLLNIVPHIVEPVDVLACLVSGPTLMLSALIMVLYIVDQVQYEAELYYAIIEITLTALALINLFIVGKLRGAIYGLFYIDLIIAFGMDIYYMHKERGWTF